MGLIPFLSPIPIVQQNVATCRTTTGEAEIARYLNVLSKLHLPHPRSSRARGDLRFIQQYISMIIPPFIMFSCAYLGLASDWKNWRDGKAWKTYGRFRYED